MIPRIGVCSWSLAPAGPEDLVAGVSQCGLGAVQLALDPIRTGQWDFERTRDLLAQAGIAIVSGMMAMAGEDYSTLESIRRTGGVRSDELWRTNLEAARANAGLAWELGISLVTFHAGFLPHDPKDPLRRVMIERLRALVDVFAAERVRVAFETGQESAETLERVLGDLDRPSAGVNFDPANMILYGMGDPTTALDRLASRVLQVHVKDAIPGASPGTWGTEMPVGRGSVDWIEFFAVMAKRRLDVDLVIERESRPPKIRDIVGARELIHRLAPPEAPAQ